MYALELFDVESIKREYDTLPRYKKDMADKLFNYRYEELKEEFIPHKQAIQQYLSRWLEFKQRFAESQTLTSYDKLTKIKNAMKDL